MQRVAGGGDVAAIDPDEPLRIAKAVADIYGDATARLIQIVARRLASGITEPGWAEAKVLELGQLRDDAGKVVVDLTDRVPDAIRTAIEQGHELGQREALRDLTLDLNPRTNTEAVRVLAEETIRGAEVANRGILRSIDDAYRAVIAETSAPGVVTGSETRRQGAQRALNAFADRGITGFRDKAGRRWELESYAEMATRTATGRAMVDGRTETYQRDGRDVVIVSDAPQECKLCRPFEGELLSISGESVGEVIDGKRVMTSVGRARSAGLLHNNCRHDLRPYIPGLTKPMRHTADPKGDRNRQRQRAIERNIRKYKRREAAAITDDGRKAASGKVREWQATMRSHIDRTDSKRLAYREQIGKAR